jgi:hypothetical protein
MPSSYRTSSRSPRRRNNVDLDGHRNTSWRIGDSSPPKQSPPRTLSHRSNSQLPRRKRAPSPSKTKPVVPSSRGRHRNWLPIDEDDDDYSRPRANQHREEYSERGRRRSDDEYTHRPPPQRTRDRTPPPPYHAVSSQRRPPDSSSSSASRHPVQQDRRTVDDRTYSDEPRESSTRYRSKTPVLRRMPGKSPLRTPQRSSASPPPPKIPPLPRDYSDDRTTRTTITSRRNDYHADHQEKKETNRKFVAGSVTGRVITDSTASQSLRDSSSLNSSKSSSAMKNSQQPSRKPETVPSMPSLPRSNTNIPPIPFINRQYDDRDVRTTVPQQKVYRPQAPHAYRDGNTDNYATSSSRNPGEQDRRSEKKVYIAGDFSGVLRRNK